MMPGMYGVVAALAALALTGSASARSMHKPDLAKRAGPGTVGALPGSWAYVNCYTEGSGTRALNQDGYTSSSAMTNEGCVNYCNNKGYVYAGTEYAGECYCGNSFKGGSAPAANAGDCNMACNGNANEICGGPNRLTVFTSGQAPPAGPSTNPGPPGWGSVGCLADNVSGGRALTTGTNVAGQMTVAKCVAACSGYKYAGVEYAAECYCGNAFANGGGLTVTSNNCNMACAGNSSEWCGGPNALNAYQAGAAASTGGGGGGAASTTSKSAAATTTAKSTATGLPAGWTYKGCWIDGQNGRILSTGNQGGSSNTIESCIATCKGAGYSIAGAEYSDECYCGNQVINGGSQASSDSDCNMNCAGNANEKCGGPNRMSLYSSGDITVVPVPTPQKTGLPGSWQYQGCITEGNNMRALPYQLTALENNLTPSSCLSACSKYGYPAAGLEYGNQCFCGDPGDPAAAGSTAAPAESDCSFPCSGDASHICGAGNRITFYQWVGSPLAQWSYASGNAAGQYQFLIGGVVVPLITQQGINGKITFVEKYGTGPPNSTGSYELDLALLNDFSKAWRPLHVHSDVFCSAGLILPDKAGRQINIGGWSYESTYGIRLYLPDGSPGTWGQNDWQENYNEVHLQSGRWYPSAMTMSNGSILVLGGEEGSNGAPVPTLEILPTAPGGNTTVYCDWLQSSDPYNLYPFPVTLHSGNIFVAYYNQARILNPVTLATVATLPQLPGAVNNDAAGRTYPFEGTAVIMPQYAPYTDPMTIMICGGSTPGAGIALDNCVSMSPESANPTWTLERMPSKRVMPCIATLPDGTYLIANGAHQGTAGFGLATDPNYNAILYDPSKPVNTRFTVMANTTIARLYHSEALLLQDGRVLISGSDPEDNVNPQEYRVEVFVPPYLLSGLARPTYTIANKDWSYGQTVTVQVTSGNIANMKASLLGAESSTHGNSMGQRIFFPAISCSGNTCSITAPPNAKVSPPGWFQLFLLDGPTPSMSQWVRIGGDPGKLGNWPNFSDFTLPGV